MRQESGRSMVEMIGVLAIMGAITAAAVVAIVNGFGMQKHMQINEDVIRIVSGVRDLHSGYNDFANINSSSIFGAMGMSDKNPYGGEYVVSTDPSNPRYFVVSVTGLNKSDCDYMVTKAWNDSVGYQASGGQMSGATGDCRDGVQNTVQITFGE